MKKRLLEDIAASSNSSLIKIIMAGEEDDMEMRGKDSRLRRFRF